MGGVASFLITMRPHRPVFKPGHFACFNRGLERFQGIAEYPFGSTVQRFESELARCALLSLSSTNLLRPGRFLFVSFLDLLGKFFEVFALVCVKADRENDPGFPVVFNDLGRHGSFRLGAWRRRRRWRRRRWWWRRGR